MISITQISDCYVETNERVPLSGIVPTPTDSENLEIGTFKNFVGYFFLGLFVPYVSAVPMFFTKVPALHKLGMNLTWPRLIGMLGVWTGSVSVTYAMGQTLILLLGRHNLTYSIIMTIISGVLFIAVAWWVKTVFFPLYDQTSDEHFEVSRLFKLG